jgi:lipoate-protein ligase A
MSVLLQLSYEEALERERILLAGGVQNTGMEWMLWQTPSCIVVPRSHTSNARFEQAAVASTDRGWPVHIRDTGGGAVVQGNGVLNLSMVFMAELMVPDRIGASYRFLCAPLMAMLSGRGVESGYRAIAGTMCDGAYNVVVGGRKLAGTAQRWKSLGRSRPGEYAVLAHFALFSNLDHVMAARAINALYADMGTDLRIEARTHINWAEIDPATVIDRDALIAGELHARCKAIEASL